MSKKKKLKKFNNKQNIIRQYCWISGRLDFLSLSLVHFMKYWCVPHERNHQQSLNDPVTIANRTKLYRIVYERFKVLKIQ